MLLQSWLAAWRRNASRLVGNLRGLRGRRPTRRTPVSPVRPEVLESRCLLTTATIDLANLAPAGVTLYGVDTADFSGRAVSGIGDINGDGYDDVLIGALNSGGSGNATAGAGEGYVVFGKADWSATPSLELSTLDGTNGFILYGTDAADFAGGAVAAGGDVNGDGFNDLLISAYRADGVGNAKSNSGETYVVFGKSNWAATPTVNLGSLNGTNGFTLLGIDASDFAGKALSAAGDVNGDGFGDILIGAPGGDGASNAKDASGESYVVFGKADWSATPTLSLSALNGSNGFTMFGVDVDDASGRAVASAGDVNGDGFGDIIIGAPISDGATNLTSLAGESYVVFGKATWSSTLSLGALNGTAGITLFGVDREDASGTSVSGAGDVNGDGFDDIIIGAPVADGSPNVLESDAGESYVVFGKASWVATPTVALGILNGTNGFIIYGVAPLDANDFTVHSNSGASVSGIGDLNGDGYDDVLIGAPFAADITLDSTNNGQSYVVYGKADWSTTPTLVTSALDGTNGFTVYGAELNDQSAKWVSGAGDFNGDGFVDLLIGAPNGDGSTENNFNSGESYVVFGGDFTSSATQVGTASGETLSGTSGVDKLVGAGGNDQLIGAGGADVLYGSSGDDVITVTSTDFARVNGGNGNDTLKLSGSGLTLDLTTLANNKLRNVELIDIRGNGANTLVLNTLEVLNLTQGSNPDHTANTLRVRRDANDTVTMGTGWVQGANATVNGLNYQVYTQGAARLLLEVPGQSIPDVALSINHATIAEDLGTASVTATLQDPSNVDVTVTLSFSGSAAFPGDYSRSNTQIVIPAGSLTGWVTLTAVSDTDVEPTDTITVGISSVSGGLEFAPGTVSTQILDDDNHAPSFTTTATPSIPENTTAVLTVIALDTDLPAQTVTYSLTGGADKSFFAITAGGVLTFKAAPDFEAPGDAGGNNVYDVQVTADDGFGKTTTQNLSVTVTDVDDVAQANLDLEAQTITWIKKQAPVTVLPQIVVTTSGNLLGTTLTITMNAIGSKKKAADLLTIPSTSAIGTTSGLVYANGKLTMVVTLKEGATQEGIQAVLRGIKFSTKGKGLSTPTRKLDVTLSVPGGATDHVSQTINVFKKAPV
ncbi:MAG: hypothetical protein JWN70_6532 [Planctomycetaceae bacterium]|nr:hypothetical protein [Planctomycetaceae bacterium]